MEWLKKFNYYKESKSSSDKSIVIDICTSMVLLNPEFLSNILDRGLVARYSENTHTFITDLENLIIAKNRLKLGKFDESGRCIEDEELSKLTNIFDNVEFDIEKDWNLLNNSRTMARSIVDKLIPDEKLNESRIKAIYWIGPNQTKEYNEDIVIELVEGNQFSFILNKNITTQRTTSFNTFGDVIIGDNLDLLFKDGYIEKWNKLTSEWVKNIYENANKNIQTHIEKFIDSDRIDTLGYFDYFSLKHRDNKYKHLGEFIKEFDKNILKFSDLMDNIWKNVTVCFMDQDLVKNNWYETKNVILNSRILENLITTSLKTNHFEDIKKIDDKWKSADGGVKMKLIKLIVDKLGCLERSIYYVSSNGQDFNITPDRNFFRKNYKDINVLFDYHVNFDDIIEDKDFDMYVKLQLDGNDFIDMKSSVKFAGGEMSGKLTTKYKFDIPNDFNYIIAKKKLEQIK